MPADNKPYVVSPDGLTVTFTQPTTLPEMPDDMAVNFLADPEIAIEFALQHLEPWEVAAFLADRKAFRPLLPWILEARGRIHVAEGDWSTFDAMQTTQ